jgi:hypothetical protein
LSLLTRLAQCPYEDSQMDETQIGSTDGDTLISTKDYVAALNALERIALICDRVADVEITQGIFRNILTEIHGQVDRFRNRLPSSAETATFTVQGLVAAESGKPNVNLTIEGKGAQIDTQVSAAKAVELAFMMIQAAEGAVTDAFIAQWARNKLEADDAVVAHLITELRDYRNGMPARKGWFAT